MAVGVDAAKWESQVEAFERVLRELKRVDYVYASKCTLYIYISGTLVKHQPPVARGNEADTIYFVSSRWNRREELDSQ